MPRVFNKGDKKEYDFLNCVAFGKTGEFLANNADKIKRLLVEGHIQTGSYDNKEGKKIYTTDIIIEKTDVMEWNNEGSNQGSGNNEGMMEGLTEDPNSDIPF